MRNIKNSILILVAVLFLSGFISENALAFCDPNKYPPDEFEDVSGVCVPINTGLSEASVWVIIVNLMRWILGIFGFIAIIAFAISGIQYLTSAGSENAIETAKRNMKWSIVGVIVGIGGLVIIWAVDSVLRGMMYF